MDAFYNFKGKKLTGEVLYKLNYQFMCRLEKEGFITLKEIYIDGTKLEANANRYTFVWRGSINYILQVFWTPAMPFTQNQHLSYGERIWSEIRYWGCPYVCDRRDEQSPEGH